MRQILDQEYIRNSERELLAGLMQNPEMIDDISLLVKREHLLYLAHQKLFTILTEIKVGSMYVDVPLISTAMVAKYNSDPVKTSRYLEYLMTLEVSAELVNELVDVVVSRYRLLKLRKICVATLHDINNTTKPPLTLLDATESAVLNINTQIELLSTAAVANSIPEILDQINNYRNKTVDFGVPSGFNNLDTYIGGMAPANFILVGARPAVGKTAFGLALAHNILQQHRSVLFISLEMSRNELINRLIAQMASLDSSDIRAGDLTEVDFNTMTAAAHNLAQLPLYIDDTPGLTIVDLRAKVRQFVRSHEISIVIIDYLQLISSPQHENRQVEISDISRRLKILAKELNVPVVAISQLNRGVEMRTDKRPQLADLRESGSLEQDADVVLLLHRPDTTSSQISNLEVIVAKNRHGATGIATLQFNPTTQQFTESKPTLTPLPNQQPYDTTTSSPRETNQFTQTIVPLL